ncbi:MOSC domain-containing protein [candidate division WOR-3 bacterium]|nr:MOSC domain-containing protein [candidate division WOR-3 bacterium]
MNKNFKILSVNISNEKGRKKISVAKAYLKEGWGIEGDAHADNWHRQVSLLAAEDIEETVKGKIKISYGDFAENITTQGVDLSSLPKGTELHLGDAMLEVTQIGKECHSGCEIEKQLGQCVMPKKGIFAKVVIGGEISSESICYYNI